MGGQFLVVYVHCDNDVRFNPCESCYGYIWSSISLELHVHQQTTPCTMFQSSLHKIWNKGLSVTNCSKYTTEDSEDS